jgi:hypothetical protein
MHPFEKLSTLEFYFEEESVFWQLQLSSCYTVVRCKHPIFLTRFGHSNIITQSFESMFEDVLECDEDYQFFQALQESASNHPLCDLNIQ